MLRKCVLITTLGLKPEILNGKLSVRKICMSTPKLSPSSVTLTMGQLAPRESLAQKMNLGG